MSGYSLCEKLHAAGAKLWVADINEKVLGQAEHELGAIVVPTESIHAQDVDIFAPCALGGAINSCSILELKAKIIGGAANNQLATPEMGQALQKQGILYCPDYVLNGGGIINVAAELSGSYNADWVDDKLNGLCKTLNEVFTIANQEKLPTNIIADRMARERIKAAAV